MQNFVSPPGSDSLRSGLTLYCWCFFKCKKNLFQHEISEVRRRIGAKFCMMVNTGPNFITPIQNFGGGHPQKILGAKNVRNLARFQTTLKFSGEYLWNRWRYSKSDKYSIYQDFSRVMRNKSSELWQGRPLLWPVGANVSWKKIGGK